MQLIRLNILIHKHKMLALYGIFTCKLQNHSTVILNNMLQYYKKHTYIFSLSGILTKSKSMCLAIYSLAFLGLIVILHSPYQGYLSGTVTTTLFNKMVPTPRQFGTNVLISINKEKCQLLLSLTAHAWVSGPDLAPQKFLLSQ